MKMKGVIYLLVVFLIVGWATTLSAQKKADKVKSINIVEALKEGLIVTEVTGAGLEAVDVWVKRKTDKPLKIVIPVGTFFVNRGKAQNMVATEEVVIDLTMKKEATYSVAAACANFYRPIPYSESKFDIVPSPESEELKKLMEAIKRKKPSEVIKQVAVWIVTDNVSKGELDSRYVSRPAFQPFGSGSPVASDEYVIRAIQLVEEAGIDITQKAIVRERVSAIKGLASNSKEVVAYSARLLGYQGKKDINRLEILISALKDKDSSVRWAAAYALEKINPKWRETEEAKRAVREFISALKDKDSDVRGAAAYALGEIKDPRAVEPLISALKDEESFVRWAAEEALKEITGKDFGTDYDRWNNWWQENKGRF